MGSGHWSVPEKKLTFPNFEFFEGESNFEYFLVSRGKSSLKNWTTYRGFRVLVTNACKLSLQTSRAHVLLDT